MPRRTPEETLAAIEEQAADDEMEEVLAMTPEERRAELRAAGFDLAAGDAQADALRAAALGAPSAVTAIRPRRAWRLTMLAAASLALLAALAVAVILYNRDPTVARHRPDPPAERGDAAGRSDDR